MPVTSATSGTSLSGQAFDIEQNNIYTYAVLFGTGASKAAYIPAGSGFMAYTANLLASSASHAYIEVLTPAGQVLGVFSGTGYSVTGSFDFSFSGQSEYVVELFYNNTAVAPKTTQTLTAGLTASSSDGYNYEYSANTMVYGQVYTVTVPTGEQLQGTIDVYEQGSVPPPTDGTINWVESGLPTGVSWSIEYHTVLNGYAAANSSLSSITDTISLTAALGNTIYYWVSSPGYSASPSKGILSLSQTSTSVSVTFGTTTNSYAVTFVPNPIPAGTTWGITMNGLTQYGSNDAGQNPDITFTVPDGSYAFSVYSGVDTASPSSGTVMISGSAKTVTISITAPSPTYYTVTFSESSLPAGTSWSVDLNGYTQTTSSTSVSFSETNGLYAFSVSSIGYSAAPASGSITVYGGPYSQFVSFSSTSVKYYIFTLSETGLASGTEWAATVGGTLQTSTTSSVSFSETNGTYTFGISAMSGYSITPISGSVTINGANVAMSVTFTQLKYSVTFAESGLPAGTMWSVSVDSPAALIASGSTILSSLVLTGIPDGTYTYVPTAQGYGSPNGSLSFNGANLTESLAFSDRTKIYGAPAVSITASSDYFINGTATLPSGSFASNWSLASFLVSSSNYSHFYNLSPNWQGPEYNFSIQVPYTVTYAISLQLSGYDAVSAYYNTTVVVTKNAYTPSSYTFTPPSGTVLSGTKTVGVWISGPVTYTGYVVYSGTLSNGQSVSSINITLTGTNFANGSEELSTKLNTTPLFSGVYSFSYHILFNGQTALYVSTSYLIQGTMSLSLQYSWSYLEGNSGLYNISWNITEVDPSSNPYSAINDLRVYDINQKTSVNTSIGYIYAKYTTVDGKQRAFFNFTIHNLSRGNYSIEAVAYNTSHSDTIALFTTTYNYLVPDIYIPGNTGGGGLGLPLTWEHSLMDSLGLTTIGELYAFLAGISAVSIAVVAIVVHSLRMERKARRYRK
jgi:hypothetical protein